MAAVSIKSKYVRNEAGHFVCPHCSKVTEKQNTMYYHMKTHEKDQHKYECLHCDDHPKFMQKTSYLHHMATAHPENPHPTAETCDKNPYAGVKFACPCCEHSTHTKSNTQIHFARTHCKTWIPAFIKDSHCSSCNKAFESSSAYLYHALRCFEKCAPVDHINMLSRIK